MNKTVDECLDLPSSCDEIDILSETIPLQCARYATNPGVNSPAQHGKIRWMSWYFGWWLVMFPVIGCSGVADNAGASKKTGSGEAIANSAGEIAAQGEIVPKGGIIRLAAVPGDTVEEVMVKAGDSIQLRQELIGLRSRTLRRAQLATLELRLKDAQRQHDVSLEQSRLKVSASQLQLRQAKAQIDSLVSHEVLLKLAETQLESARSMMKRMESIAADEQTRSFISRLDIDRQRISVGDAELEYRRQQESLAQAKRQGQWSLELAEQQLAAAQSAFVAVEKSTAVDIVRNELDSARRQDELSAIRSTIDGTVLSVETSVGEMTSQFPLLQIADLSSMSCEAEVYEADAKRIQVGAKATIKSPVFGKDLQGTVERIGLMVGRPQLKSADPLARVDRRALSVVIAIHPDDCAAAARWLQLQVEVRIVTGL